MAEWLFLGHSALQFPMNGFPQTGKSNRLKPCHMLKASQPRGLRKRALPFLTSAPSKTQTVENSPI